MLAILLATMSIWLRRATWRDRPIRIAFSIPMFVLEFVERVIALRKSMTRAKFNYFKLLGNFIPSKPTLPKVRPPGSSCPAPTLC